ncbi:hypothetical protein FYK55_03130 [Roseiconus nitratireducens]|uniref:Uncharacterized protein n=1 Tax=Roseiconus nitratireducens TaxID=2605748 RepID=A0A5M6DI58_9BACT|nr:hypothetical protein [Roseiconus nitratireducens]KAA5545920.1 hypothetical protein FYK55_03130 [Roseiconus nitratireducens]
MDEPQRLPRREPFAAKGGARRHVLKAVLLCTAILAADGTARADHHGTLSRIGRWWGVGHGDGYHTCKSGGCRPCADLPPRTYYHQFAPAKPGLSCGLVYPAGTGLCASHPCDCDTAPHCHHGVGEGEIGFPALGAEEVSAARDHGGASFETGVPGESVPMQVDPNERESHSGRAPNRTDDLPPQVLEDTSPEASMLLPSPAATGSDAEVRRSLPIEEDAPVQSPADKRSQPGLALPEGFDEALRQESRGGDLPDSPDQNPGVPRRLPRPADTAPQRTEQTEQAADRSGAASAADFITLHKTMSPGGGQVVSPHGVRVNPFVQTQSPTTQQRIRIAVRPSQPGTSSNVIRQPR